MSFTGLQSHYSPQFPHPQYSSRNRRVIEEPNGQLALPQQQFKVEDLTDIFTKLNSNNLTSDIPIVLDDISLASTLGISRKLMWWARTCKNGKRDRFTKELIRDHLGEPVQPGLYTTKKIEKGVNKSTGKRVYRYLNIPSPKLKSIQKKIVSNILSKVKLPDYITGFVKGKSIRDTAAVHSGKNIVVSLDIENFFPSIKESHVREAFRSVLGYPEAVCRLLSELCTMHNFVPQGAPSSPAVSNIVSYYFFDKEINDLLQQEGFDYTRYADDLTFSTNKEFIKHNDIELEKEDGTFEPVADKISSDLDPVIDKISKILRAKGFRINKKKTKVMRKGGRQWVLGQVVNVTPNVLAREFNKLRAILHNITVNGIEEEAKKTSRTHTEFLQWLKGSILFVKQINPHKGERLYEHFQLILDHNKLNNDSIVEIPIIRN